MRMRFKVILRIIFVLLILGVVALISFNLGGNTNKQVYKVVDKIDKYNYTLEDRDSKLMQNTFKKLKDVLNEKEIDYNLYAEYLSSLFIIDLFTINNKDSKYDVGGYEYVASDILDNYKLNVEDTLYKYINENSKKDYPAVKSIDEVNVEEATYTYNNKEYKAYNVQISWDYEKDLGYYKKGEIMLILDNDKLSIVSFKGVDVS